MINNHKETPFLVAYATPKNGASPKPHFPRELHNRKDVACYRKKKN